MFVISRQAFSEAILFLLLLLALILPTVQAAPVKMEVRNEGLYRSVVVTNEALVPVTVVARIDGYNYRPDKIWPLVEVVPPRTVMELDRVHDARSGSSEVSVRFERAMGDATRAHAPPHVYRLPYQDGAIARVHKPDPPMKRRATPLEERAMRANVFDLPAGTAVAAARAGVVMRIHRKTDKPETMFAELIDTNCIAVLHEDGTVALYANLTDDLDFVAVGQIVPAGARLGYAQPFDAGSSRLVFLVAREVVVDKTIVAELVVPSFYTSMKALRFTPKNGEAFKAEYPPEDAYRELPKKVASLAPLVDRTKVADEGAVRPSGYVPPTMPSTIHPIAGVMPVTVINLKALDEIRPSPLRRALDYAAQNPAVVIGTSIVLTLALYFLFTSQRMAGVVSRASRYEPALEIDETPRAAYSPSFLRRGWFGKKPAQDVAGEKV